MLIEDKIVLILYGLQGIRILQKLIQQFKESL